MSQFIRYKIMSTPLKKIKWNKQHKTSIEDLGTYELLIKCQLLMNTRIQIIPVLKSC